MPGQLISLHEFRIEKIDTHRHDIDRSLPRTPQEIFDLNTMMVDKMLSVIPRDVPIVPSLGNNDIYPHNVLAAGPNRITEHFLGCVIDSVDSVAALSAGPS